MNDDPTGTCQQAWGHEGGVPHSVRETCVGWTPLTAAPTAPVLRCMDKLEEDGSTFRCTLAQGHEGRPHECGDWEWWSPIGIDLGSKAAAPTGSTEPQTRVDSEGEQHVKESTPHQPTASATSQDENSQCGQAEQGSSGSLSSTTERQKDSSHPLTADFKMARKDATVSSGLLRYTNMNAKVGSTEEAKGEKPNELDADNNSRIAFQLLASAFAQIADEDAREILGRLSNDALCQLREPNSTATQQEWRIWMSPKNARNRTWWRDYEYRADSVEARQDAARTPDSIVKPMAEAFEDLLKQFGKAERDDLPTLLLRCTKALIAYQDFTKENL